MPCNTITTQTLSGGLENGIPAIVEKAFAAAGFAVSEISGATIKGRVGRNVATWSQGAGLKVVSQNASADVAAIKREYSKAAVSWAASRAGWKVGAWVGNKVQMVKG
jgi:hypothetical protein